jgi:hypothetical protein
MLLTCALAAHDRAQSGWTLLTPALAPSARSYHGAAFDLSRGTTVLFGGWSGHPLADTWEWNGSTWTMLATSTAPSARTDHAMAYDYARYEILLFGGSPGATDLNDTWVFANGVWTQRSPANSPGVRSGSRLAYDPVGGTMLLFGGASTSAFGLNYRGDTWSWDGVTWRQRTPAASPSPRFSPAMATDTLHGKVVLFGGVFNGTALQDIWTWDGTAWQNSPGGPPPLRLPRMNLDPRQGAMVLFGGRDRYLSLPSATWVQVDGAWRNDPRPMPPTLDGACVTLDPVRARMVMFGGDTGPGTLFVGTTWEYDLGTVAVWQSYGSGCPGGAGPPTLNPYQGSLPKLGIPFVLELANVPGTTAAFTLGTSHQQWHGQPLPLDLTALGMPGCSLLASADVSLIVAAAAGRATCSLPVPATTALTGAALFAQCFALDVTANAFGAVVSNAGRAVLGPF